MEVALETELVKVTWSGLRVHATAGLKNNGGDSSMVPVNPLTASTVIVEVRETPVVVERVAGESSSHIHKNVERVSYPAACCVYNHRVERWRNAGGRRYSHVDVI